MKTVQLFYLVLILFIRSVLKSGTRKNQSVRIVERNFGIEILELGKMLFSLQREAVIEV